MNEYIEAFKTRKLMNISCSEKFETLEKRLDIIAFGLKSLRNAKTDIIKQKIKKGLKIRILTMHPDSEFIEKREMEENINDNGNSFNDLGCLKKDIQDLTEWISELKVIAIKNGYPGNNIELKYYTIMPLQFYFRMDDYIYFGTYFYKKLSQDTISFKTQIGQNTFYIYKDYFYSLWSDEKIQNILMNEYVFSFGCGQAHEGFAQRVKAKNWEEAREKMLKKYGIKRSFQYTREQWDKNDFPFKEKFLDEIII